VNWSKLKINGQIVSLKDMNICGVKPCNYVLKAVKGNDNKEIKFKISSIFTVTTQV